MVKLLLQLQCHYNIAMLQLVLIQYYNIVNRVIIYVIVTVITVLIWNSSFQYGYSISTALLQNYSIVSVFTVLLVLFSSQCCSAMVHYYSAFWIQCYYSAPMVLLVLLQYCSSIVSFIRVQLVLLQYCYNIVIMFLQQSYSIIAVLLRCCCGVIIV